MPSPPLCVSPEQITACVLSNRHPVPKRCEWRRVASCSGPPASQVWNDQYPFKRRHPPIGRPDTNLQSLSPSLVARSEEHTSELQSLRHIVCRLLLENKH